MALMPHDAADLALAPVVLRALTHLVDLHGWTAAINDRGLRLSHRDHAVTLGLPKSLRTYLDV